MKKVLFYFLICGLIILPNFVLADNGVSFDFIETTMSDWFYDNTFDNLVLGFSLENSSSSNDLQSLVVKNNGTAKINKEISKVVLWLDDGNLEFNGFGEDSVLAEAEYLGQGGQDYYVFDDINYNLYGVEYFYVSVETRNGGTDNKTFQFAIPEYNDVNGNDVFDNGDTGIFLEDQNSFLPEITHVNFDYTYYRDASGDFHVPKAVITNLGDGDVLTTSSFPFMIEGVAKDQGGSYVDVLNVCVDNFCDPPEALSSFYSTWQYELAELGEGEHEIYLEAIDFNNNIYQSDVLKFSVIDDTSVVSDLENYTFEIESNELVDSSSVFGLIVIKVLDQNLEPVKDRHVFLDYKRGSMSLFEMVKPDNSKTDQNGKVVFYEQSDGGYGEVEFEVLLGSDTDDYFTSKLNSERTGEIIKMSFVKDAIDYTHTYRLVKVANSSAVYFLDENNIRHAYPLQSVYEAYYSDDFSLVETISDEEMADYLLGENVPFPSGTLIKIPSIPKVYEVHKGGIIYWLDSEEVAEERHGEFWAVTIRELPESFYLNYGYAGVIGESL